MKLTINHFKFLVFSGILSISTLFQGCGNPTTEVTNGNESETTSTEILTVKSNQFSEDSAFLYIQKQVDFGYRIPGTKEHLNCANWLFQELIRHCDTAYFQKGNTTTHQGKSIPVYNLVGSINPSAKKRVLLASHWDSRPIADQDNNRTNEPISGANDGASGVGVLLELARIIDTLPSEMGVDIIFFDAEDLGASEVENSFCLGSQFWAKNPHIPNYKARMGVLLDMVGSKNAEFLWESNSNQWGNFLLAHIWSIAHELGYQNHFKNKTTGMVIDDHVYVYQGLQIPMIDIIDYNHIRGFPKEWHTHDDNIQNIHKPTLKAVGHTLESTLLNPPPSLFY